MGCVRANYADITQEVAQKASCLAPKTFASTLKIVQTALASNKTPNGSPSKSGEVIDRTAYATLISEHKIGQPLRVKKWMEEAQAALVALPRFQHDFASRFTESSTEVRVAVFFWVCRAIKVRKRFDIVQPFLRTLLILPFPTQLSAVQIVPLVDKYGVSLKTFNRLVKMMEDECVDLKESIHAKIKEMLKKKAKVEASAASASGAASASKAKTPISTPSHSRSASPTKSAMRDVRLTPSLTSSATKRKVAFSDVVSASEDDVAPDTPSRKRPRRAAAASAARVMPMSKAATASSSEGEGTAEDEDVEMSDTAVAPATPTRTRPVAASTSTSTSGAASPVAGPSTPRRPTATPTHAYRTPPSARIQMLSRISDDDDEEEAAAVGDDAEASEGEDDDDDDTLPPSLRFRPVFLDRVQWARRSSRLARDRVAAEWQIKELVGRWGYPFELLQRASARVPAR